jgi:hypothetical protein
MRAHRYFVTILAERSQRDPYPPSWYGGSAPTELGALRIALRRARHIQDQGRTGVVVRVHDSSTDAICREQRLL